MRDNYIWQLLYISKDDRSVVDYTHEFLRLGRHALDVMQDDRRSLELFVTGLGAAYISIRTEDRRLDNIIEEARQLERRHIMHDTISDPYASSSGVVMTQKIQQPMFQMGSVGIQTVGTSQQGHRGDWVYRSGRHNRQSIRPLRFRPGASSGSSS